MTDASNTDDSSTERAEGVFRLIYVSRTTALLDDASVRRIAEAAQRANSAVGVTGMLIACAGEFLQVLEGERDDVMELFKRIDRDRRHIDVSVVSIESDVERIFRDWSMGCFAFGAEDLPDGFFFDQGSDKRRLRFDALERVDDMLRTFYAENHAAGLARVQVGDAGRRDLEAAV